MNKSKSGLFLMELIIAICFFAISSAICVQLFAAAHTLSQRSKGIQMAVVNAQSVAEGFRVFGSDMETLASFWNTSPIGDSFVAWFNEDWKNVGHSERFSMTVHADKSVVPARLSIVVTDTVLKSELYSVSVSRYLGR